jgi:hypothetical protein
VIFVSFVVENGFPVKNGRTDLILYSRSNMDAIVCISIEINYPIVSFVPVLLQIGSRHDFLLFDLHLCPYEAIG